jgi:hypothetical protein
MVPRIWGESVSLDLTCLHREHAVNVCAIFPSGVAGDDLGMDRFHGFVNTGSAIFETRCGHRDVERKERHRTMPTNEWVEECWFM